MILAPCVHAQIDEICSAFGHRPSSDEPRGKIPYLYGRVIIKNPDQITKSPKVTVNFLDFQQSQGQLTIDRTGNYCFRRTAGGGGTLIIEVNGLEVVRKTVSSLGPPQQREDFEVNVASQDRTPPPGVVSVKYARPPNDRTSDLYKQAAEAEAAKDLPHAATLVAEIVQIDPGDFIAWAKLGSLHAAQNSLAKADSAVRKSLELRPDYTPALLNLGMILAVQKDFEPAIDLFKRAIASDPNTAIAHRMLGEAYLQVRKGSLALEALNEALRLDPVGMAESHLLIARLYDLAGAKSLAAREYKLFLKKIPNDPDKKKFEKYIKENPE